MSNSFSDFINNNNVDYVRKQIKLKNGHNPFYATIKDSENILTDFDHFPYSRFYRGVYNSSDPIVIEREAGWRAIQNNCYLYRPCPKQPPPPPRKKPCFEGPCSVVFPCNKHWLNEIADKDELQIQINSDSILQYR